MMRATSRIRANGRTSSAHHKCTIRFGGLVAVNELDMQVRTGEIYGLIGPNGAGKTTIFNLLTGVYEPTSGEFISKASESTACVRIRFRGAASRELFKTSGCFRVCPCWKTL